MSGRAVVFVADVVEDEPDDEGCYGMLGVVTLDGHRVWSAEVSYRATPEDVAAVFAERLAELLR